MFGSTTLPSSGLGGPTYRKEQMPEHFHEHFIVSGYRHPRSSAWQCVLSLFDATNETLNFWTHFLPSWYFMWVLKGLDETLDFRADPYTWPLLCYLFACCLFPLASAVAHTFNVMSAKARHVCFFLDYSALSLFSFGVALSFHAYSFPRALVDTWFHAGYIPGAGVAAVLCTFLSCSTRFMRPSATRQCLRLLSFSVPCLFNSLPILYRLLLSSQPEEARLGSQTLHTWQLGLAAASAFLYASHLPERWKPGQFDIVGHSHQLFHVTTVLGVMEQLQAVLIDMQDRRATVQGWKTFDLPGSLGLMGLVLVTNTVIITVFSLYLYLANNHTATAQPATTHPATTHPPTQHDSHDDKCKCA